MGRQSGKNNKLERGQSGDSNVTRKVGDNSPNANDKDPEVLISMSRELEEEGNRLFQKRDCRGALAKYEKAIKLLPGNHVDVSYLRSNMAACYMHMGVNEYSRAIRECSLALEVTPNYGKALLKRAKCYEGLNRLDLALRDVNMLLKMEPTNVVALEVLEKVTKTLEQKGLRVNGTVIELPPDYVEPPSTSTMPKAAEEKTQKKKHKKVQEKKAGDEVMEKKNGDEVEEKKVDAQKEKMLKKNKKVKERRDGDEVEEKKVDDQKEKTHKKKNKKVQEKKDGDEVEEKKVDGQKEKTQKKKNKKVQERKDGDEVDEKKVDDQTKDKQTHDKVVVEEKISGAPEVPKKTIKLVFGEDIRVAQLPNDFSPQQLREVIFDRYPISGAVQIKYRDQEGDLVTITSDEELRWAEASAESQASLRLYLVKVSPQQDPFYAKPKEEGVNRMDIGQKFPIGKGNISNEKEIETGHSIIDDWIIEFAKVFKDHVGFESDLYFGLHELGFKVYFEAMDDAVTTVEAQDLFDRASGKFQEMAALALLNWGNVDMSRAMKRVYFAEDESLLEQIKVAYDWAQGVYLEARQKYEAALRIKPDFYEALLALGQQQFEQAKLSLYYAIGNSVDLESWPSEEVIQLYNKAQDNIERGMQMFEESETNLPKARSPPEKMGLDELFEDISAEETSKLTKNMRSQINMLWATILYERSILEFRIGQPVWHKSLETAVKKFQLAGASPTDIEIMIKNHVSDDNALDGLGFKIDETAKEASEMHETKMWQSGISSFRLDPLLRRRVSKLYDVLKPA